MENRNRIKTVVHLTSVHPRFDTRIFLKECTSLSKRYNTSLIVADGLGNKIINNMAIYDVGKPKSRIHRILSTRAKVLHKALELNADIYHFHDPELLLIAKRLKKKNKIVIYDMHEDFPMQILSKPYLNRTFAKIVSRLTRYYENYICSKLDAIVAATPHICNKFIKKNQITVNVCNYPILSELHSQNSPPPSTINQVCYAGGLSKARGIKEAILAAETSKISKIVFAGNFSEESFQEEIKKLQSKKTIFVGQIGRAQIKNLYQKSLAGLVTLKSTPNHLDSLPIKMFEYMSAGIPVIASNFPLWKEIILENSCGVCVDPDSPKEISEAINTLLYDKTLATKMGVNGRQAVEDKYNWSIEEKKLLELYGNLLRLPSKKQKAPKYNQP